MPPLYSFGPSIAFPHRVFLLTDEWEEVRMDGRMDGGLTFVATVVRHVE
jgi:hypothetical protein